MNPALAAVDRPVHSVAIGNVVAKTWLARAHVDDIRIERCNRNRSDRRDGLMLKQRLPVQPAVGRLPYAAGCRAKIENVWITRDAGNCFHAPSTVGAKLTPLKTSESGGSDLLCKNGTANKAALKDQNRNEDGK